MRIFLGVLALVLYGYDLPELPHVNTARFLPVIRAQIDLALGEAKARPRDGKAAGSLAMTLHAYQQYDAAARVYQRAHLLEPQNFDWVYLLGNVEMAQGQFDAAVKSYRAALRIRPEDLVTELRLAEALTAIANWEEARTLYLRILDDHPDCPQAWYGLGRVQAEQREHAAAAQSYAKACELFPAYGIAHFALAGELRRLGNNVESEQHLATYAKNVSTEPPLDDALFKRIHELNLGVQVHLQRAAELEKAGRLDEAVRENEAALAIDPNDAQVHVNLISLYGRTGDPTKARLHFEAVTKLTSGRSDAWYDYGVLLFHERNYAEAEQAFRRALEINPNYAEAHNNLGAICEQQGRLDDAANEFRQAIANRPDYPLARFHLGRILVNNQKYDEAIHQFIMALTPEDEETTVYLYALAATYVRAGDRAHAQTYFQKARDAAVAHGQSQLLISIDRDLKKLAAER
jgi:tetratricopeptide (TPR) repeat protein